MNAIIVNKNLHLRASKRTVLYGEKKIFAFGFSFLLLHGSIRNLLITITLLAGFNSTTLINNIFLVLSVLFTLPCIVVVTLKKPLYIVFSLLLLSAIWFLSYSFNFDSRSYIMSGILQFFVECLPYFWLFLFLFDKNNYDSSFTFAYLKKISRTKLTILLIVQTMAFLAPWADVYKDYMSASYILLDALLILLCGIINTKHNLYEKTLCLTATIFIIILGCRGALLCEIAFLCLFLLIFKLKTTFKKILFIVILMTLFLLFVLASNLLAQVFVNNRILNALSSFSFFADEQRILIFDLIWKKIVANPFGLGVLSDRGILINSNVVWETYYSHNLFLELGINFGYLGFLLFVLILFLSLRTFRDKKLDDKTKYIFLAFFCFSLIKLLFSSSLWIDMNFWAFLGILFAIVKTKKVRQLNE